MATVSQLLICVIGQVRAKRETAKICVTVKLLELLRDWLNLQYQE